MRVGGLFPNTLQDNVMASWHDRCHEVLRRTTLMGTTCSANRWSNSNSHDDRGPVVLANFSAPRRSDLPHFVAVTGFRAGSPVAACFRAVLASLLLATGAASFPASSQAALSVSSAPGISVIPADEVLSDYTHASLDGALLFEDPSGSLVPLITDIDDPQIANPGDGSFHAADAAAVVATLEALPPSFTAPVFVQIFVLPYPRSNAIASSATTHAIYLSPGVYPLEDGETLRALVVHELGHVIDKQFLTNNTTLWDEYVSLRGIDDNSKYYSGAVHADRPAEIFAEDFRVLVGDALAAAPAIENPTLIAPDQVDGLSAWFIDLSKHFTFTSSVEGQLATDVLRLYPNPMRVGRTFTVQWTGSSAPSDASFGQGTLEARVYDAAGRVAQRLSLEFRDDRTWTADVPDLAAGTYWLRPVGVAEGAIPIRIVR
ncbi:MAG: hypothetical protein R3E12_12045 [Candidatus Eisenbacteria bacterium]|uniref:Uncharacterized protein n=1 Tax=Eiseniibacteriota bacterium TaxID=2212470 RepID=A0A956RPZ9_UNCEI|nr:hypothetical protein [Candidatus Eisenbacteria bacterium]